MIFIIFVIGLCIGSFVNVLIDRLPNGESVLWGRSHCDFCKKTLRWYELIPLFSFLIQHGKCRRCHKKLSFQYPLIELFSAVSLVFLYWTFNYLPAQAGSLIHLFAYSIIFYSLLVIFVADLKYQIIPDSMIVIGLIGVGMQGSALHGWQSSQYWFSAIGASLFFFLLWLITRGRGMGFGDVKLAFLLGLFLGFPLTVVGLYAAFLTGAAVGVILILIQKKSLKTKIAFGPFLIIGTLIAQLWGQHIILWWQKFL